MAVKRPVKRKNADSDLSVDLLAILNRRKGLVFVAAVFGLCAGAAYFLLVPPKYESSAQVLLMQNDSASMASDVAAGGMSVSEELLATHMSLIQSRGLVRNAITCSFDEPVRERGGTGEALDTESLPAAELREFLEKAGIANLAELPSIQAQLGDDGKALDYVIDNLYVTRGGDGAAKDARILSIAFRHRDEDDARLVVAALLLEYQGFVKSKFQDINKEAVDLIGKAQEDIKESIDDASKAYAAFRKEAPILASVEGGANIHAIRYEELASEISQLDSEIDAAKARIKLVAEGLERLSGSEGPELEKLALIDQHNAERLGILVTVERGEAQTAAFQATQPERMAGAQTEYSSLLAIKAQLVQAKQDFGPKHPEVQALANQVSEMETFFVSRKAKLGNIEDEGPLTPDDVMTAYQSLLENDLMALEQRKADLAKQRERTQAQAKELIESELEDDRLSGEITRQEELYSSVIERLRDLNMQEDSSALIQEVIAEPEVGEKVAPNAPVAVAIAMLSAMFLAGASILLAELSDKSIHSAEDLEAVYEAPILSHIPDFEKDAETRLLMKRVRKSDSKLAPELLTYHDPKSRMSELYRTIRTKLLFNAKDGKHVIAVTGPNESAGKSTSIANIAISLAHTGKSVLLIDADMRRPTIHRLFGLEEHLGLSEVLNQKAEFADAIHRVQSENLSVMTCGTIPVNPTELLSKDTFAEFLEQVRQKFDYVLIDCPPLLPVSDPAIVAQHVDGVVLVVSVEAQSLPEAKHCRKTLDAASANVAGLVVNRVGAVGGGYLYSNYGYESPYKQDGYHAAS